MSALCQLANGVAVTISVYSLSADVNTKYNIIELVTRLSIANPHLVNDLRNSLYPVSYAEGPQFESGRVHHCYQ